MVSDNKIKKISTNKQLSIPHFYEFIFGYLMRMNPVSLSSTLNKNKLNYEKSLCFLKFT